VLFEPPGVPGAAQGQRPDRDRHRPALTSGRSGPGPTPNLRRVVFRTAGVADRAERDLRSAQAASNFLCQLRWRHLRLRGSPSG